MTTTHTVNTGTETLPAVAPGAEAAFDQHAALIMWQDGATQDQAKFRAWCEGPNRLAQRQAINDR